MNSKLKFVLIAVITFLFFQLLWFLSGESIFLKGLILGFQFGLIVFGVFFVIHLQKDVEEWDEAIERLKELRKEVEKND